MRLGSDVDGKPMKPKPIPITAQNPIDWNASLEMNINGMPVRLEYGSDGMPLRLARIDGMPQGLDGPDGNMPNSTDQQTTCAIKLVEMPNLGSTTEHLHVSATRSMRNAAGEVDSLEQRHSKQERQLKSIENRLDKAESPQEEIDDIAISFGECKKIQVKMSRETGSVVLLRVHEGRRKDLISCLLDHPYLVTTKTTSVHQAP
ncbi:hypothetical protein B0H13DRAFT_2417347 [Mycena leptocephala]|nr:hypothetical protein B0H13DRAFT_2417347 [Mycena leptocephala]